MQLPISSLIVTLVVSRAVFEILTHKAIESAMSSSTHPCLNLVQLEIAPFDQPTPKTLSWNQSCSRSDAPFARYSPSNCTVTLKPGFGVTQSHRKRHYLTPCRAAIGIISIRPMYSCARALTCLLIRNNQGCLRHTFPTFQRLFRLPFCCLW